jgi:hypothetical protein
LSIARVSYAAEMSASASGTLLEQQLFGVQVVTPSAVYPVAPVMTGLRLTSLCAVTVYVVSAAASLATSDNCSVASVNTAPGGMAERSNFIRMALATR